MFPDIKSISLPCMLLVPLIVLFAVSMTGCMTFTTIITWIHVLFPFLVFHKPYTASSSLDILPMAKARGFWDNNEPRLP